jgi:hypothetical protein
MFFTKRLSENRQSPLCFFCSLIFSLQYSIRHSPTAGKQWNNYSAEQHHKPLAFQASDIDIDIIVAVVV